MEASTNSNTSKAKARRARKKKLATGSAISTVSSAATTLPTENKQQNVSPPIEINSSVPTSTAPSSTQTIQSIAHSETKRASIVETKRASIVTQEVDWESETPLSEDDLKFWEHHGYVVLHNAVPQTNLNKMVDDMWNFLGFTPKAGYDDCYQKPLSTIGFVELYHSQTMWDNRCYPRIYHAFTQLWGRKDLWTSIDRCGVKLPSNPKYNAYQHKGFTHWDLDPTPDVVPLQMQGAMALTDTDDTMGGFHCYPGMHRYLKDWMKTKDIKFDADTISRFYDLGFPIKVPNVDKNLKGKKHVILPMKAGDLVIWRGELAHGNGENLSDRPRLVQYITMFPAMPNDEIQLKRRVDCWQNRLPGGQNPYPQLVDRACRVVARKLDERDVEQKHGKTATLTELGEKLVGLVPW